MFFSLRCPDCGTYLDEPLDGLEKAGMAGKYLEDAQIAYDRGANNKRALADIDAAIQFEPELAEAHNLRGLILDAMGKTDEAIRSYEEAIRLNPDLDKAKANLVDADAERQSSQGTMYDSLGQKENIASTVIIGFLGIVGVICAMAGLFFLYFFGRDYIGPKTTVVFEPDYAQVSTVDSSALEKTAEILTIRADSLGYSNITFIVNESGQIVGRVPSHVDAKTLVERISPIGLLEFVDFGETVLPDGTRISTDLENIYVQQTNEKRWHTIMTNNGINDASVSKDQFGNFQFSFSLTNESKKEFADYTSANVGTYLGIVLDKVIMSTPIINQPIMDGQGMISGSFTQESAQDLAAILHTTPLPIPIKLVKEADPAK